jgi:hypothetical protein
MSDRYKVGFVGRARVRLSGFGKTEPHDIGAGALVQVSHVTEHGRQGSDDDGVRHTVVLLRRHGREDRKAGASCDGVPYGALDPEPGVIDWRPEDSAAAIRQGWEIFWTDAVNHERFELQAVTGSEEDFTLADARIIGDRFRADNEAWLFVWHGAVSKGDHLCKRALEFLYARSPVEYAKIRKFALTTETGTGSL